MKNLIGNTCITSYMTTKCYNQQLINPFTWCKMDFNSCYNLVKHFDDINWLNFSLVNDDNWNFSIIVDNLVTVQYVHYHFDPTAEQIKSDGKDVFYNKIWEFIVSKYIERSKRMVNSGEPPVFIFANAADKTLPWLTFSEHQQAELYSINSPYKIFTCYKHVFPHPNAIQQTIHLPNNGLPSAMYIYERIKGLL